MVIRLNREGQQIYFRISEMPRSATYTEGGKESAY